ncbi:hypothetical protein ACQKM9_20800 [Viridibacillus sp. NPDC093762]|uniref:hypothetical protein n=1 Tax=Viridibacillus sp. NPDC093762 TaxID=3390720 RepID=UPI003D05E226
MNRMLMLFILFVTLFFVVACTSNNNIKEMESSVNNVTSKEIKNNLISYYETINLKNAIESSFNKKVFKKKGYPDGYDLTLSRAKKEVVLVIRPYSKKNFNYLKDDLQSNIEEVLQSKKYTDYKVKVLADWNKTNQTEKQEHEQKVIDEIANIMKQTYKINVLIGTRYSATDGRIVQLDLMFYKKNKEIIDPNEVNNFHKEFLKLAQEKGFNVTDIPIRFKTNLKRDWEMKVMPSIDQGLKEINDLKVTSTTIIDDQNPIIINTSIDSIDKKAKEIGKRIEELTNEFFQYTQINKSLSGPYEIHVLSKDNKKIN